MDHPPADSGRPDAPEFWMRHLGWIAYAMSVGTGALGQVLFLGHEFGGKAWSYGAAIGLAAFAEVVMSAAGDKSLDHRAHRRAWRSLLSLATVVACYGAAMNLLHFLHDNKALAFTFGGATLAGFLLHVIDGHIRVAAYLREDDQAIARAAAATPAPVAPARPAVRRALPETTVLKAQPTPKHAAAPVNPSPEAAAPTTTVKSTALVVRPKPADPGNVTPIRPKDTTSQLERAYQWFATQVDAANGDVTAVNGPALNDQFGTTYLNKKITEFRARYRDENPATAVNQ